MTIRLREIIETVETIAPPEYAAEWDNSGLQIGDPHREVRAILVALDITAPVVTEAEAKKANLIITHHPLFFKPIRRLLTATGTGSLVQRLMEGGISVYAAHTNLDAVAGGVNRPIAEALGMTRWTPLQRIPSESTEGFGGLGALEKPRSLASLVADLKKKLKLRWIRQVGSPKGTVRRIAFCGGSGASLFPEVLRAKPDLFITGDIKYHDAINYMTEGIPVLDIGHFGSEQGIRRVLAGKIRQALQKAGSPVPVHTARSERDPFRSV